ncbi:hypothetical protein ACODT3_42465 [Streptomyces sp. 4.24]|uniref:hypothetical protein n=1 Tax=Streptomyces tritrimontium TaxID=3406573 RepID=UPI003BB74DF8
MSLTRENTTWQSANGTWNIGFYEFQETGYGEDWDPEWDVEYSDDAFWFASTGHRNPDEAYAAYTREHPNPGGTTVLAHTAENRDEITRLDAMAKTLGQKRAALQKELDRAYRRKSFSRR